MGGRGNEAGVTYARRTEYDGAGRHFLCDVIAYGMTAGNGSGGWE